jgi:pimeloyl-ACP methyl ester carboxylesterase
MIANRRAIAETASELYVRESGAPSAPAVVFVHGGGPNGSMWTRHIEALGGTFHCLAPDLPGFGRSHQLPSISLLDTADLLVELIRTRVPSGRAHVVGLSYGGSVVLGLLARHAEAVDRAIIDGAGPFASRSDRFVVAGAMLVSPLMGRGIARVALRSVGLTGLGESLRSASGGAIRRAWSEGFLAPVSEAQTLAPSPTLLVAGERETPVRASNAAFAALMPSAEAAFVPGLGHAWFAWRPELHIRMVEAWLSGAPLPDGLSPEPPNAQAVARLRELLASRRQGDPWAA